MNNYMEQQKNQNNQETTSAFVEDIIEIGIDSASISDDSQDITPDINTSGILESSDDIINDLSDAGEALIESATEAGSSIVENITGFIGGLFE